MECCCSEYQLTTIPQVVHVMLGFFLFLSVFPFYVIPPIKCTLIGGSQTGTEHWEAAEHINKDL